MLWVLLLIRICILFFQIKLVNINPSDIADGKPSIVLGLIWTIILYFQVSTIIPDKSNKVLTVKKSATKTFYYIGKILKNNLII